MKLLEHIVVLPTAHQTVTIVPISCVHADDEGFDEDLFEECLDFVAKTPHCYAVGLGDYRSFARTTYRKHIRSYTADEDSQRDLDNLVKAEIHKFYTKYLKRIRGKLWGLAEGNHHFEFMDGTTDTQMLCRLANVPYLEKGSLHRIVMRDPRGHGIRTLTMLTHHGDWSGGTMTTGGSVNSLESHGQAWDVDIVVAGHDHRKMGWTVPVLHLTDRGRLKVVERPRAYIRAGCFTKGYVTNCVTYAERKLMKPTALGWVTLRIHFKRIYEKEKYALNKAGGMNSTRAGQNAGVLGYQFRLES